MKNAILIARALVVMAAAWVIPVTAIDESRRSESSLMPLRPYIEPGMKRETVTFMLGEPCAKPSREVWVYFKNNLIDPRASGGKKIMHPERYDTLLVFFKGDRVDLVRLTDNKSARAILARLEDWRSGKARLSAK
jgi:hypothetical protein